MRYPPHLLDEIRARLSVSHVVGRKVPLKRAGREFKGLSPFKTEKTPSFTVNDQKGFYHCFASGEHGDIFTFLIKTEGLSFPEAVERLAEEAGVPLPKVSAHEEAREDERQRLYRLMEASAEYFRSCLMSGPGADGRRYLEKRGLARDAIAKFRIGYAPNDRSGLKNHLAQAGFSTQEMIAAGMVISGDDIPVPYDRFRHRIIFPITDLRDRVIAFGGRALDPDAPAKYLNSPETPLFHKGHVLYNAFEARGPAHDKGRLVAVEGYMDVIALSEAGFGETVAPLGTALTEDQVKLLWRLAPEPILCFDGDAAGRKAASRAVEIVLPHLKPGYSLRFAFLPEGVDPDDYVRRDGRSAMEGTLAAAKPLVEIIWNRELNAGPTDTPERKAALEMRLDRLVGLISDPRVQFQYRQEFRGRIFSTWRQSRSQPKRTSINGASVHDYADDILILALTNHPWLIDDFFEDVIKHDFKSDAHSKLLSLLLTLHARDNRLTRESVLNAVSDSHFAPLLEQLQKTSPHADASFLNPQADKQKIREDFGMFVRKTRADALRQERLRVSELFLNDPSEEVLIAMRQLDDEIALLHRTESRATSSGFIQETDYSAYADKLLMALDNKTKH
jgi:DNA primase